MSRLSRRAFFTGALAFGLSACSSSRVGETARRGGSSSLPLDLRPSRNVAYDAWVLAFKSRARARGISNRTLNAAFSGAGFLPGVVTRDRNQIESRRTLEDYLSIAASDERISKGRAAFAQHQSVLARIEQRFGVDPYVLTAIWGLESFYGERQGEIPVISAVSTLAFDGRRGRFFEAQLVDALKIIQNGDISPRRMTGSWAGAMGHTQFIPTTFTGFAVDFNGDGRRDIWGSDPSDALAGTANYLQRNGWRRGLAWGREDPGGALQPQVGGPRFTTTANFNAIKRYNNSTLYALGVGHLSDRIRGAGPLRQSFPPDANGLTKADRMALQRGLKRAGFDPGDIDGVIGRGTTAAIEAYQQSRGLPANGVPSRELLARLPYQS